MDLKSPKDRNYLSKSGSRSHSSLGKPLLSSGSKLPLSKSRDLSSSKELKKSSIPESTAKFQAESILRKSQLSPSKGLLESPMAEKRLFESIPSKEKFSQNYGSPNEHYTSTLHESALRSPISTDLNLNPFMDSQLPSSSLLASKASSSMSKSGVRDLKHSSAYVSAMKALQNRIKALEEELNNANRMNEKLEHGLGTLESKLNEERHSFSAVENSLKVKLNLVENELFEKQKLVEELGDHNSQLRQALHTSETERTLEVQKTIREANQIQGKLIELEDRFRDQAILNEELQKRQIDIEHNYQAVRADYQVTYEKNQILTQEKKELKFQFDEKINSLVHKVKDLESQLTENEHTMRRKNENERKLQEELLTATIQNKEIRSLEETNRRQAEEIQKLKNEITIIKKEQERHKMIADYSSTYAQDLASQNAKLINNYMNTSSRFGGAIEDYGPAQLPTFNTQEADPLSRVPVLLNDSLANDIQQALTSPHPERASPKKDFASSLNPFTQSPFSKSQNASKYSTPFQKGILSPTTAEKKTLHTSELYGSSFSRAPIHRSAEKSTPNKLLHMQTGSFNNNDFKISERLSPKKDDYSSEKYEYENVVKTIIELERDIVELNRKYQICSSEMLVIILYFI